MAATPQARTKKMYQISSPTTKDVGEVRQQPSQSSTKEHNSTTQIKWLPPRRHAPRRCIRSAAPP
eukprot:1151449-Pelagomonas_calceolata.AAC.1